VINKIVSIPGALIVVVIYFLVSLGFWQIDRADEKRDIERQIFEAQSSKSKLISDPLELIKKEHYNVLVSGIMQLIFSLFMTIKLLIRMLDIMS
jgi:surfeit locus 1 family protein